MTREAHATAYHPPRAHIRVRAQPRTQAHADHNCNPIADLLLAGTVGQASLGTTHALISRSLGPTTLFYPSHHHI